MIIIKLWVRVLTDKYLRNHSVLDVVCPSTCSPIWRMICKAASLLREGFTICVGDGLSSFWFDFWTR